MVFATIYRLIY